MNFVFVGPQGSGKGTQAKIIAQKNNLIHISTGDLLRALTGELKKEAESYTNSGNLVPDEFILKILKHRLEKSDCANGVILDGYPRNMHQACELEKMMKIDNAFNIQISDEEAVKRISGRFSCPKCGVGYNTHTEPKPKNPGICDHDGEKLVQRKDDTQEAVKKRLEDYHKETTPIIKFYNTVKVNGEQPIEKVTQDIEKAIKFLRMFK